MTPLKQFSVDGETKVALSATGWASLIATIIGFALTIGAFYAVAERRHENHDIRIQMLEGTQASIQKSLERIEDKIDRIRDGK